MHRLLTMKTVGRTTVASAVLAMALVPTSGAIAHAAAQLRIVPNPIAQGEQATAFGSGFCSSSDCSKVSIEIADNTVASGRADSKGTIAIKFTPGVLPGQYTVTARQTGRDGQRQATTGLSVLVADTPEGIEAPGQPATKTKQRDSKPSIDNPPASRTHSRPDDPSTTTTADSRPPVAGAAENPDDPHNGGPGWAWWLLPALALPALAAGAWWLRRRSPDSDAKTTTD